MSDLRMDAYYYGFIPTGNHDIDKILSAVACAGKSYHNTCDWNDDCDCPDGHTGNNPIEWIQNAANKLNDRISELEEEIELDKSIIHNQHELIKSGERRGEEKAKQRIAELEAECRNSYNEGISVGEKERLRLGGRILELEATVEQLRCCGNCTHFMIDDRRALYCENEVYPFPIFGKCDKWEAK